MNPAAFYFGVQSDEGADDHYQCKHAISCGSGESILICIFWCRPDLKLYIPSMLGLRSNIITPSISLWKRMTSLVFLSPMTSKTWSLSTIGFWSRYSYLSLNNSAFKEFWVDCWPCTGLMCILVNNSYRPCICARLLRLQIRLMVALSSPRQPRRSHPLEQ
jgi:hypothetical protein